MMTDLEQNEKLIAAINLLEARLKIVESKAGTVKAAEPQTLRDRLQADREQRIERIREEEKPISKGLSNNQTRLRKLDIPVRHTTLGPPPQRAKNGHPKPNGAFVPLDFYCYHEGKFSKVTIMATSAPAPVDL